MAHLEGEGKLDAPQQQSLITAESFRAEAVNLLHTQQPRVGTGDSYDRFAYSLQMPTILPQIQLVPLAQGSTPPPEIAPQPGDNNHIHPQEQPQSTDYTVQSGDNLWKIAKEHLPAGASNADIANYVRQVESDNPMPNPNLIMPGQMIKLPEYKLGAHHSSEQHYYGGHHHHGHHMRHHETGKHHPYPYPQDKPPVKPQTKEQLQNKPAPVNDQPPADHRDKPVPPQDKSAPLPQDKTQPSKPSDKPQSIKDQPVKPTETQQDTHPVTEELQHLRTLAHQKIGDKTVLANIETSAQALATTEQQKIDLYKLQDKTLTDTEARTQARAEIVNTYKQAERLLSVDKAAKLDNKHLQIVAAEMLRNAAHPEHIEQGNHKTCQTTAMESLTYKTEPSKAAKLVADVALTGQFTAYDGTTVKIDPEPHDAEAERFPVLNKRSLASQIFQETAINLAWAKKDPTGKTHYVEMQAESNKGTPIETLVQEPGSPVHIDSKYAHTPYLFAEDLVVMQRLITGKSQEALVVEAVQCDPKTICVTSTDNLARTLEQRKEAGKLPIILYVNTANDGPFKTQSGDWHAILITDFIDGLEPKIRYYNWWGRASTNQEISVSNAYRAMQKPQQPN